MGELNMQELETAYDAAAEFIHDESLVSRARMRGAIRMIVKAKNAAQDECDRLKADLERILEHLGAAAMQSIPSDDQIIAEHVKAALAITRDALKGETA